MIYLTDSDFSHLILFARLRSLNLGSADEFESRVQTQLAKDLVKDIENGFPSEGNEVEFQRIQRVASIKEE